MNESPRSGYDIAVGSELAMYDTGISHNKMRC